MTYVLYSDRAVRAITEVLSRYPDTPPEQMAELIYKQAGRAIMEGWKQDMGDASRGQM